MYVVGTGLDGKCWITCEENPGSGNSSDGWIGFVPADDFDIKTPILVSNKHKGVEIIGIRSGGHDVCRMHCSYNDRLYMDPPQNLGGTAVPPLCTARDRDDNLVLFAADSRSTLRYLAHRVEGGS